MFGRIVLTAIAAGLISGVFVWGAHMVKTTPLILAAEIYEDAGTGAGQPPPPAAEAHPAAAPAADEWAPADGLERGAFTLLSDVLTSVGFAFLLVGAITLSGRRVDWRRGVVWGLCGFTAIYVSPALGLAPELPGMQAAELGARQAWWLGTVAATAVGLALIAFQPRAAMKALGVGLVALPHLIGAPGHAVQAGAGGVPPELAAEFAIATLVVSGLFWMVLGGLTGYFYNRFERP
ncbi:MAG: CbtA family protein [Rhodospirillales bacterium]